MRRFIFVALILIAACAKQEVVQPVAPPKPKPKVVRTETAATPEMPAYTATKLDGSPLDLSKERGKVVFLNAWATWCVPCRYEIPELQKLHDKYSSRGFEVIGVSVDESENRVKEVQDFVAEQKITYPVALDPDGRVTTIFQTTVLPTSALIDKQGHIVWKSAGLVSTKDTALTEAIESALAR